jgi:fucose 4-O-acetylase-like acetyltransferase
MGSRVHWIDVGRGIGIIIVLYAHALNVDSIRHIFYSFHMPLFFFLSGLTFHLKKDESFATSLKKATKNILIPYFLFAFLSFFYWYYHVFDTVSPEELQKQFFSIFYGNSNNGGLIFNNILWFLPCLFVTRIAFAGISKVSTSTRFLILTLFIISIAGFLFSLFLPKTKLPFSTEAAINGVVFFGIGFLWHRYAEWINTTLKQYALVALPIFSLLCIGAATIHFNTYGHQVDMRLNRLDNYFLFYTGALSGIIAVMTISILIGKNRILEYIGRHSLILFVWHLILFGYFAGKLRLFLTPETIQGIRNTILAPLYTALSIIIILTSAEGMRRIKLRYTRKSA